MVPIYGQCPCRTADWVASSSQGFTAPAASTASKQHPAIIESKAVPVH